MVVFWLQHLFPPRSGGRRYRKVWKVAIATASAEEAQGPDLATRWRRYTASALTEAVFFN